MVLNHMHPWHGNNYTLFIEGLTRLRPILQELSNVTRIVWMQQAPVVDSTCVKHFLYNFITKLHHYNAAMRSILKSVL